MRIFLNPGQTVSAADVVGGFFVAQRHLLAAIRSQVLAGSGLTAELAEILVELYLADGRLSSTGHTDGEGYISFRDLLGGLGYSQGLLSRRISWLCQRRWAETKRAAPDVAAGVHGNCQKVRITKLGREKITPVWQRHVLLAERLLRDVSPAELAAHDRINKLISDQFHPPRLLMDNSIALHRKNTRVTHRAAAPKRKPLPPPPPAQEPVTQKNYLLDPNPAFLD